MHIGYRFARRPKNTCEETIIQLLVHRWAISIDNIEQAAGKENRQRIGNTEENEECEGGVVGSETTAILLAYPK